MGCRMISIISFYNSARAFSNSSLLHNRQSVSGPRYMIRVTVFCTLLEPENTRTCENCTRNARMRELHAKRVQFSHVRELQFRELHAKLVRFSHVRVFSGSRNVQKRATKSDTSGHCLLHKPPHQNAKRN